jgi:hypothetical protein
VTKVRLFVLTKVFSSEFSAQSLRFVETIKVLQRGSSPHSPLSLLNLLLCLVYKEVPISLAIELQYGKLQKPEAHITVPVTV